MGLSRRQVSGPQKQADGLGPTFSSSHPCLSSLPKQVPLSAISPCSGTMHGRGEAALTSQRPSEDGFPSLAAGRAWLGKSK